MGYFLPFCPLTCPKNENFKKMKKMPGDIIILHKCTKNHDHMLYCSWDMTCDGCNCYFSFWASFCPFSPLATQKIKISKKWKKCLEILSFYTCVAKIMIRWLQTTQTHCSIARVLDMDFYLMIMSWIVWNYTLEYNIKGNLSENKGKTENETKSKWLTLWKYHFIRIVCH